MFSNNRKVQCIMNVSLTFFAVKKPLQKEYAFSHNGAKARFIICYELLLVSFVSLQPKSQRQLTYRGERTSWLAILEVNSPGLVDFSYLAGKVTVRTRGFMKSRSRQRNRPDTTLLIARSQKNCRRVNEKYPDSQ